MARERCWKCKQMKSDVDLRACDYRLCEECFEKNETALHQLWKERPDLPGARPKTTPPKTTTTKTTNSTTKHPKSKVAPQPEHNIASPQAAAKPISASQPASKVTRGTAKNKNHKAEESGSDLLSQKVLNRCAPKNENLIDSQAYHVDDTASCPVCHKSTISDSIEISSLKCCVCSKAYHGECLSIDELLLPLLHVVVDIGGWCCVPCRKSKKESLAVKQPLSPSPSSPVVEDLRNELVLIKTQIVSLSESLMPQNQPPIIEELRKDLEIIKCSISSFPYHPTSYANAVKNSGQTDKARRGANTNQAHAQASNTNPGGNVRIPPNSSKEFRSAVLSTVHHEMKTINHRASNVVVSGLQPSVDSTDEILFKDLCLTHLGCAIEVRKTKRLGDIKDGRVRPILVTLASAEDVSLLLVMAKSLRSASDPVIRREVYINKHLTPAEAKVAYEARVYRRTKQPPSSASDHPPSSSAPSLSSSSSSSQSSSSSGIHSSVGPAPTPLLPGGVM